MGVGGHETGDGRWEIGGGGRWPEVRGREAGIGRRESEDGGRGVAGELGDIGPLDLRSRNLKATTSLAT